MIQQVHMTFFEHPSQPKLLLKALLLGTILLLFSNNRAFAQDICEGNLGENIFENGDFGSGREVVFPSDPSIAPGYTYTTIVPPNDGSYSLINNSMPIELFGTWFTPRVRDNDPNGYMMLVNASFSPGIFYEQTVDNLCENTLYVFSADIINVVRTGVTGHSNPNVTFLLNDEIQLNTGEIPQDETWKTFGFTFTTEPGQTTLKLTLRNNAPGGIGNDLAIDNISFQACGPQALILPFEIANICEDGDPIGLESTIVGDQYEDLAIQWQESMDEGFTWQDLPGENGINYVHDKLSSGFYYYRYLIANGPANLSNSKCRIISNTKVVHVVPKTYTLTDTICDGNTFQVGNSIYEETGTYLDSLISSIGCDSIVTLNLTVLPDMEITVDLEVEDPSCFGSSDGTINVLSIDNAYEPTNTVFFDSDDLQISPFQIRSGNYQISITDRYGCFLEQSIELVDPQEFLIELGPDTVINLGDALTINPSTNYPIANYDWTPAIENCPTPCLSADLLPFESGMVKLVATSDAGCIASDSLIVNVLNNKEVYIPNAFSPNGDGINDNFSVQGKTPLVQRIVRLQIFDRWGQIITDLTDLTPNNTEEGWNGRDMSGQELSTGIYVYLVTVEFLDKKVLTFSGDVLLLRSE